MRKRVVVLSITFFLNLFFVPTSLKVVAETDVKIGAYYYIWWSLPSPPYINHWEKERRYMPFLGEYNSSEPSTADRHILWAKQHGIDFFAVSWLGIWNWYDHVYIDQNNLRNGFLEASHLENFSFCLFYETRIVLNACNLAHENFTEIFINDISYAALNYFNHTNYLRVNEKPVLFIYDLPFLYGNLTIPKAQSLFDAVNRRLADFNVTAYCVGDIGGGPSPDDIELDWLYSVDAVTSYFFSDPSKGWHEILEDVRNHYPSWVSNMSLRGKAFIPNVYPGFDKVNGVELTPDAIMFENMLDIAFENVDEDLKIVMITSWNEWLESTVIEPSIESGEAFLHKILLRELESKLEATATELALFRNLIYAFLATTIIFVVLTFYFARKRKRTNI